MTPAARRTRLPRALLPALLVGLLFAGGVQAQDYAGLQPLDRIAAVVNEDVITRLDLNEHIKMAADNLRRQGTPLPPTEVFEKQVLERMIAQKTQLQFAKEVGLRIDDAMATPPSGGGSVTGESESACTRSAQVIQGPWLAVDGACTERKVPAVVGG